MKNRMRMRSKVNPQLSIEMKGKPKNLMSHEPSERKGGNKAS
jgi:hypothetical protein